MERFYPTEDMIGREVVWTWHSTASRPKGTRGVVTSIDPEDDREPLHIKWEGEAYPAWNDVERYEWAPDNVNRPEHYTSHPSGVECIAIVQHMNFPLGNVIKYVWRADSKNSGENAVEDLEKAMAYLKIEIDRRKAAANAA